MAENFKDFGNVTINDILRFRTSVSFLLDVCFAAPFTSAFYDGNADFGCVCPQSLLKHNFIKVAHIETWNVYVAEDRWGNKEVIDITDEQYNNLPDYFKIQVEKQTRKRYYYEINEVRCLEFMKFTRDIATLFEN